MLPSPVEMKIVGVTFVPEYPDNVYQLQELSTRRPGSFEIKLRRNPDNQYDSNAVEVWAKLLIAKGPTRQMLGHIDKYMARQLAPELDSGVVWEATFSQIVEHPDNPGQPGLWIWLNRVARHHLAIEADSQS